MRFFFVDGDLTEVDEAWRPSLELQRHLQALRLAAGETVLLLPPAGDGRIATRIEDGSWQLGAASPRPTLPLAGLTLATAWPKGTRADDLVVRATEAGVGRILPLHCTRSVSGRDAFRPRRIERWQRLILETCQQCGRPDPPELITEPLALPEARAAAPGAHPIALLPGTLPLGMDLNLHPSNDFLLFVGPEGGFDSAEEDWFRRQEITCAGLLPTILRIEAAGPAAATLIQHHWMQQRGH